MNRAALALATVTATAALAACSLLIGLDERPGRPVEDASTGDAPTTNADADGPATGSAYLFAAGGHQTSGTGAEPTARTLAVPIHPDGSLGAWTRGPDLPEARYRHGVIGIKAAAHVIGGYTATEPGTADVISSRLLEDGGLAPFIDAVPLFDYTTDACPVIVGSRTYVMSPGIGSVQFATINGDGTFGGWQRQGALDGGPSVGQYGIPAVVDDQIFWFAWNQVAVVSRVRGDGKLDDWRALAPMPIAFTVNSGQAVASGRFIYLLGGHHGSGTGLATNEVYVAAVDATGQLGAWRSTEPYPQSRNSYSVVAYNGYVYVLGGEDVTDVSFAKILPDGSLDTWRTTTPLPEEHRDGCIFGVVTRGL